MKTQNNFQLTEAQIRQFKQDGFLVVREFISTDEVQWVKTLLNGLFEQHSELPRNLVNELSEHKYSNHKPRNLEIARCVQLERRLAETEYYKKVRMLAKQLLGSGAHVGFDHAILKPAHSSAPTQWHQDEAYEQRFEDETYVHPKGSNPRAAFWLPLQNVSAESGCMQFIPGSHKGGLLPHRRVAPGSHALMTEHLPPVQAVACPIKVGDLTIHAGRTLHYAGPNMTNSPRLAWILDFGGESYLKALLNRSFRRWLPVGVKPNSLQKKVHATTSP